MKEKQSMIQEIKSVGVNIANETDVKKAYELIKEKIKFSM